MNLERIFIQSEALCLSDFGTDKKQYLREVKCMKKILGIILTTIGIVTAILDICEHFCILNHF